MAIASFPFAILSHASFSHKAITNLILSSIMYFQYGSNEDDETKENKIDNVGGRVRGRFRCTEEPSREDSPAISAHDHRAYRCSTAIMTCEIVARPGEISGYRRIDPRYNKMNGKISGCRILRCIHDCYTNDSEDSRDDHAWIPKAVFV